MTSGGYLLTSSNARLNLAAATYCFSSIRFSIKAAIKKKDLVK
jgi:hypothetical protein